MEALDAYVSEEEVEVEVPVEAPVVAPDGGGGDDTELEGDERSKADKDAEREAMEKACNDAMGQRAMQTKPKPSQKARPKEKAELPWKQPRVPSQPSHPPPAKRPGWSSLRRDRSPGTGSAPCRPHPSPHPGPPHPHPHPPRKSKLRKPHLLPAEAARHSSGRMSRRLEEAG